MTEKNLHNKDFQEVAKAFAKEHPELDLNNPELAFHLQTPEKKQELANAHNKAWQQYLRKNAPHIFNQEKARTAILFLASNQRRKSTETTVEIIHQEYKIISLRNDKNPEMWVYDTGVYVPNAEAYIEERVRSIYEEAYTTTLCNEVIAKIRADTYTDPKEFFEAEPIEKICVQNGVLNLLTGVLEEHTPKEIHFTKLPVTYDRKQECPAIKKHLQTIVKHEEDLPVIQEIFGWMLWKEYRPEKAIMLLGSGRNGKGKTIDLMKRFLGPENVAGVPLQDLDARPFSIAELHKKLANIGADLPKNALAETGRFKNLTGGDYVTADRKHQSMLHFTNYAKMVYAANKLPVTYDITHAFFARWIIIDFPYKFYEEEEYNKLSDKEFAKIRDVDIIDKISTEEELSGLLNWAYEGLQRLRSRGGFSYSKNTKEVSELWIRRSDSFAAFCMDCLDEEWDGMIEKSELRRAYSLYCRENKLDQVSEIMQKRYLAETFGAGDEQVQKNNERMRVWKGIIFKSAQGAQDAQGFSTYRENRKNAIGSKTMCTLGTLRTDTTDSVGVRDTTLNMDELKRDILALPSDNEVFLRAKYGDERIDYWIKYGDIFNSRPGTLKVMK